MEFEKIIKERSSTRKFSDVQVEEEKLIKILDAGRMAPTAKNMQPEEIYVIRSEDMLKKLDEVCPCRYNAQTCLVVCIDKDKSFKKENHTPGEMDASIITTHMMLEATNLGVDNIWIEMFDEEKTSELLNLEENIRPICILNLGYKTIDCPESPNHNKRKELNEFVHYL